MSVSLENPGGSSTGNTATNSVDLKIADWEFLHAEQILLVYLHELQDAGFQFTQLLSTVGQTGIQDQDMGNDSIAVQCQERAKDMTQIMALLSSVEAGLTGTATGFVSAIDQADSFVY